MKKEPEPKEQLSDEEPEKELTEEEMENATGGASRKRLLHGLVLFTGISCATQSGHFATPPPPPDPPRTADAYCRRAELARKQNRTEDALIAYRAVFELQNDHLGAHKGYQKLLVSQGREKEARFEYASLLEETPAGWTYLLHARLLHDPEREEELYRMGLELSPDLVDLHRALAGALKRQQRYVEAREAYAEALRIEPGSFWTRLYSIRTWLSEGRAEEGLRIAEEEWERDPEDPQTRLLYVSALLNAHRINEAHEHLAICREQMPDDMDIHKVALRLHFLSEDWDSLRQEIDAALEKDPHDPWILVNGGTALGLVEGDQRGEQMIREGFRLEPFWSYAAGKLAFCALKKGRRGEARRLLERALQLDPTNENAHYHWSSMASAASDYEEAVEHLERAIEIAPHRAELHNQLGRALRRLGHHERAREELEIASELGLDTTTVRVSLVGDHKVISKEDREAKLHRTLATEYLNAGQPDESLRRLERLLELRPNDPQGLWLMGRIQQRQGALADAYATYSRAKEGIKEEDSASRSACASIRAADCLYALGRSEEAVALYREIQSSYGDELPQHEHLDEIVASIDAAPESAPSHRLDLRIEDCTAANFCVPQSLVAILHYLGLPGDLQAIGSVVVENEGARLHATDTYLDGRDDVEWTTFLADRESVCDLLDNGYPVMLVRYLLSGGEYNGHASVIIGYDDFLGVFWLEDSNWASGADRLTYAAVEGERAVVIMRMGEGQELREELRGSEFCSLVNLASELGSAETDEVLQILIDAVELEPELARAHEVLGWMYRDCGQPDEAAESFERAVALPGASPKAWFGLGLVSEQLSRGARAREAYEMAERLEPDYVGPRVGLIALLFANERLLTNKVEEDPEGLEHNLERAAKVVAIDTNNARAHYYYGIMLSKSGAREEAIVEFEYASLLGLPAEAHDQIARIHYAAGDIERAIASMKEYAQMTTDPDRRRASEAFIEQLRTMLSDER